jgi:hypothetical protein
MEYIDIFILHIKTVITFNIIDSKGSYLLKDLMSSENSKKSNIYPKSTILTTISKRMFSMYLNINLDIIIKENYLDFII